MTWPKQKTAHTGKPVRNSQRQAGAELTPASRRETYTGKPAKAPQTTQGVEPGVFFCEKPDCNMAAANLQSGFSKVVSRFTPQTIQGVDPTAVENANGHESSKGKVHR